MDERAYKVEGGDEAGWFVLTLAGERLVACRTKEEAEKLVAEMNALKRLDDAAQR